MIFKKEERELKKISKSCVREANRLFSEINLQQYCDQHPEMTIQYLMDILNPNDQDQENEIVKKMISRWIATEYFNSKKIKNIEEPDKNLAIIMYQFFIYKFYNERFSFLNE